MTAEVTQKIRNHVPDADITHQHAAEITYTLPYSHVSKFARTSVSVYDEIHQFIIRSTVADGAV